MFRPTGRLEKFLIAGIERSDPTALPTRTSELRSREFLAVWNRNAASLLDRFPHDFVTLIIHLFRYERVAFSQERDERRDDHGHSRVKQL